VLPVCYVFICIVGELQSTHFTESDDLVFVKVSILTFLTSENVSFRV